MRLGQGFNSYTQQICVDDAVVISATRPENVLTNDGTTMRIVAKVLGRPSAWLRQHEVLFDDERLKEAQQIEEAEGDDEVAETPQVLEGGGEVSSGEQPDENEAEGGTGPRQAAKGDRNHVLEEENGGEDGEPEETSNAPAQPEGNAEGKREDDKGEDVEDISTESNQEGEVKETEEKPEETAGQAVDVKEEDETENDSREADETKAGNQERKDNEGDVVETGPLPFLMEDEDDRPEGDGQDEDGEEEAAEEGEGAKKNSEEAVEVRQVSTTDDKAEDEISNEDEAGKEASAAKSDELPKKTQGMSGNRSSQRSFSANQRCKRHHISLESNEEAVEASGQDALAKSEAAPERTPEERRVLQGKQLVKAREERRGEKKALDAATKFSSGLTLEQMANKHKNLVFAKRKNPLLGSGNTQQYQIDNSHGVSQTVSYTSRFVDKLSEITEDMGISASMSVKLGTIAGSARGSFIDTDKFKESDLNFYISVKVVNQSINFRDALEFNGLDNIAETDFTKTFGDCFISGFQEGGEFNALVSMKVLNKDKLTDIKAEASVALNAGAAEIKADANVRIAKANLSLNTETTIQVSYQGGGQIKNPEEPWNIETLQRAAMRFPDNVAASPQRIYAILTKYESLRSFQARKTPTLSAMNYENVALYTNELMDTFMSYKSLYRRLTTNIYAIQNGALQFKTVGQVQQDAIRLSDAVKESGLSTYPATLDGLDSARSEIRRQMNEIVLKVDLLADKPHKLNEKEAFISSIAFEALLPEVEPVARRAASSTPLTGVKFAPVTEPDTSSSDNAQASEEDKANTTRLCYTPAEFSLTKNESDKLKDYLDFIPGITDVFRFTPPIGNTDTGRFFSTMDFTQSDFVLREVTIGMAQGIVTSISAKYPNGLTWTRGSKLKDQAFFKISKLGTEGIISASVTCATEIGNGDRSYIVGVKLVTNRGKSLVAEDQDAKRLGHNRRKMGNKVFKDFETVFLNAPVAKGFLVGFWGASRETMAKTPVEIPAIYRLGFIWSASPVEANVPSETSDSEQAEIGAIHAPSQQVVLLHSENNAVVMLQQSSRISTNVLLPPDVYLGNPSMREMGNARVGSKVIKTDKTYNILMGLTKMDIENTENFRLHLWDFDHSPGQEYKIGLGTSSGTAQLFFAESCVLSFGKDDDRIQTGRHEWCWDYPWNVRKRGEKYSKRIQFPKPFKQVPQVTTFITHIDTSKDEVVRCHVLASNIDTQGFTLNLESWA
ncbi:hypothetical protein QFC19_002335, partial [Naganishia cerealis]